MTEEQIPDPVKVGGIAQKIVALLQDQSSETRHRAISAAMTLLGERLVDKPPSRLGSTNQPSESPEVNDLGDLFGHKEKLKPSENAYLCAAHHFSLYGNAPFSLDELRSIAGEAGVIVPDRLDMTLKQAGKGGKKFFQPAGRDAYRPTAAAGVFFNERWSVKPGKKTKGASGADA